MKHKPILLLIAAISFSQAYAEDHADSAKSSLVRSAKNENQAYAGFISCRSSTDVPSRQRRRFQPNHVHNALIVRDSEGGWRPAEADEKNVECAAVLTDEKGNPIGPVEAKAEVRFGETHSKIYPSLAYGAMLDGKSEDRRNLQYIALELPGLPLQWVPTPCGTRGRTLYTLTRAPHKQVEVSQFFYEDGKVIRNSPKKVQENLEKKFQDVKEKEEQYRLLVGKAKADSPQASESKIDPSHRVKPVENSKGANPSVPSAVAQQDRAPDPAAAMPICATNGCGNEDLADATPLKNEAMNREYFLHTHTDLAKVSEATQSCGCTVAPDLMTSDSPKK